VKEYTTPVVQWQAMAQPVFYKYAPKRFCFMHHPSMNTTPIKTRGQRLKAEREARGWNQSKLGKKAGGISQQVISKLENDGQDKTSVLISLAGALGINPEWLETGVGEKELPRWKLILDVSTLDPNVQDAARQLVEALKNGAVSQDKFLALVRLIVPDLDR
jgi:transcriptional regulator with XRE-family HTH domain